MTSRNDRYYKTYVPMGKDSPEEMEIEVYYSLGGHNHWTGEQNRRGIYLSFWPVTREKTENRAVGTVTRTIGDERGRRMLLQEQKRRHDAHGIQWARFIKNNIDAIAEAAIAQNWPGVAHVIRHPTYSAA
jgi:hypothetical protein